MNPRLGIDSWLMPNQSLERESLHDRDQVYILLDEPYVSLDAALLLCEHRLYV